MCLSLCCRRPTQGLAEGNSALATRAASDAKEARIKAGQRAEQAEAQVKTGFQPLVLGHQTLVICVSVLSLNAFALPNIAIKYHRGRYSPVIIDAIVT